MFFSPAAYHHYLVQKMLITQDIFRRNHSKFSEFIKRMYRICIISHHSSCNLIWCACSNALNATISRISLKSICYPLSLSLSHPPSLSHSLTFSHSLRLCWLLSDFIESHFTLVPNFDFFRLTSAMRCNFCRISVFSQFNNK